MKISVILLIALLMGCKENAPIQAEVTTKMAIPTISVSNAGDYFPIQVDAQGKLKATCSNKKCLNMLCVFNDEMKLNCECKEGVK